MQKTHAYEIVLVFLMALCAYGYFYTGLDWNSSSRLSMVKAVVDARRFQIELYSQKVMPTMDKALVDGHYYSDKPIGSALLGIEFYSVLSRLYHRLNGQAMPIDLFGDLTTFFAISLLCACLASLVYSFVKQVSSRRGFALLITAAVCFGTPFYPYGTAFYGHSLAGLMLFTAFFLWFSMRNEQSIGLIKVLSSGILLGYAFITEYQTALIIFLIGLYVLYVLWEKGQLLNWKIYGVLALGSFFPISIAMFYNYVIFKSPFATGYSFEAEPGFAAGQQGGFMGIGPPNPAVLFQMTFHTEMGLFWQSPVLLLALIGWFVLWRNSRYRAEALLAFAAILVYFTVVSGYYLWWGGGAFTPRDVIPSLPFFAIPLAFLPRKTQLVAALLTVVSIAQMLIVTASASTGLKEAIEWLTYHQMQGMFQKSIIYEVYFHNFVAQSLAINRGQQFFGLSGFASLVPFVIVELALLGVFAWMLRSPGEAIPTHD